MISPQYNVFERAQLRIILHSEMHSENSLWIDHSFGLEVNNIPAGFLTVSYIPSETMQIRMPRGIVDYLQKIKGYSCLRVPKQNLHNVLCELLGLNIHTSEDQVKAELDQKWGKQWQRFQDFNVDNPWVANVRIFNEWDNKEFPWEENTDHVNHGIEGLSFRKRGLSFVLYQHAALWLTSQNWVLKSDTMQTESGSKVWLSLQEKFGDAVGIDCKECKPRKFLYGSKIDSLWIPCWVGSLKSEINQGEVDKSASSKIYP